MGRDGGASISAVVLANAGTHNPREESWCELATTSLRQTTSCGYGSRFACCWRLPDERSDASGTSRSRKILTIVLIWRPAGAVRAISSEIRRAIAGCGVRCLTDCIRRWDRVGDHELLQHQVRDADGRTAGDDASG